MATQREPQVYVVVERGVVAEEGAFLLRFAARVPV
jgi:hypothetical protein